jgi:O-methyltransferase
MHTQADFTTVALKTRARYLNLLEAAIIGELYRDPSFDPWSQQPYDANTRALGRDWPSMAHSMIGRVRLRSLRQMCETVLLEDVPGDMIETGVWRGGACILMKGVIDAYGAGERRIFVADSFQGLPPPNPDAYPADAGDKHHTFTQLSIPRNEVENNFRRYGLLDERVVFLEGWFKDTLPGAPIDRLSILRLDGDMYESTTQAITALYHKVSRGGFVIVDDYGYLEGCRTAIRDFRANAKITAPLLPIDGMGVWWRVE